MAPAAVRIQESIMEDANNHLPEDDIDARLARKIGDALERDELDSLLNTSDNPFVSALGAWSRLYSSKEISGVESGEVWSKIVDATSPDSDVRQPRMRLVARRVSSVRWAAAASIVLLALVTVFALTLLRPDSSRLVAQSDNQSESIVLDDGSTIVLRRHSRLYQLSDRRSQVVYRLEGEASFAVTHNPSRSFVLEAGSGEISVLGTTFVVSTWGDETRVYLSEGSVRFANRDGAEAVLLEPGQESILKNDRTLSEPVEADEKEFLDWISDQMVFEQRTVESVLGEFGHHFGVELTVPDSLLSETITGTIELSALEQSLNTLGTVLGGEFVVVDSTEYAFRELQ
jgi:transmembrane sensor